MAKSDTTVLTMDRHCHSRSLTVVAVVTWLLLVEFEAVCGRSGWGRAGGGGGSGGGGGGQSNWAHCCEHSFNPPCKSSCKKAKSREDLVDACLVDQDSAVLNCIEKTEVGLKCCSKEASSKCITACRTIFVKEQSLHESDLHRVSNQCTPEVVACIQNYTKYNPARKMSDSLSCCEEHAINDVCQTKCRSALNNLTKEEEIVNEVSLYCGIPDTMSALWQCFLRHSATNRREVVNVVSTRLGCCHKASSSQCRNLCIKKYSLRHLEMDDEFDQKCFYSPLEGDLNTCLEEVENRCEPGCNNLKFCTNFNNHPEISFRSCDLQSDLGAQQTARAWSSGTIMKSPTFNFDIPIKDISVCEPSKWKAIACILFIKPCHSKSLSDSICRSDCLDVLSKCLDSSRITPSGVTAETICNKLSPQNSSSPCISLSLYSGSRSVRNSAQSEVITPCNPNPCNGSQICVANWKNCTSKKQTNGCRSFQCIPGCSLREGVHQIIPLHAFIRAPDQLDNTNICYQACRCGHNGFLRHCLPLVCVREDQCVMPSGMIQDHGSVFDRSCSRCACQSGKVTCTKRFCPRSAQSSSNDRSSLQKVLPCDCPVEYSPVCSSNGQTYPSVCLAQCARMLSNETHESGSCSSRDPCLEASCLPNERCVEKRQKCLWSKNKVCKQFECVALKNQCDSQDTPVCGQNGMEYRNPCRLLLDKQTLAYRGQCLPYCRRGAIVCGVDGDEYASECAAWANGVIVDYIGRCRSVGRYQGFVTETPFCSNVSCSNEHLQRCEPIIPPGACCPVCAGEIRLLMSEALLESATSYLPSGHLTVADILDALRLHIKILHCEIFGYLNVEGDLTILLMPIIVRPSPLQIEVCMAETKRLGYLLSSSNPALTTYLALSVFLSADVRTCCVKSATADSRRSTVPDVHSFMVTVVLCLTNWCWRSTSRS